MKTQLLLPLLLLSASPWAAGAAEDTSPAALAIFQKHCADCHSDGDQDPELHGGINLVDLLKKEDVVKEILDRIERPDVAKGRMPKSKDQPGDPTYLPPLGSDEKAALQAWAKGGPAPTTPAVPATGAAPAEQKEPPVVDKEKPPMERSFLPLREEVRGIAADLAKVDPTRQGTTRYLTLTNLYNLGDASGQPVESDGQLDIYRAAVSKLLNSISRAGRISVPVAVDPAKIIYRFDLRDYGLTAEDWEDHVVKGYPYALRGIDGRSEDDIARDSQSRAAYVRADWFVFAASQPPLYHELLKLPATEPELEKQEGVDTLANLRTGKALRAGFRESGVSQGNRLIERHEARHGMYWKSYDFTPLVRTGGHDLFRSPLGPAGAGLTPNKDREFVHDGGEIIFALPNGLHGYLLTTADGKRLDRGPSEIVQDRARRDGVIINGISCMACHDQGMKYTRDQPIEKFVDEVGPVALKAGLDRQETHVVQDLYASKEKLHAAVLADEAKYQAALAQAIPGYAPAFDPVARLYKRFREEIRLETLASEFGEQDDSFLRRLKDTRDKDMESIAAQLEAGVGFPRSSWLDQFRSISKALGYQLQDFHPIEYAEFTSGAATAGGKEGRAGLADGGRLIISTDQAHYSVGQLMTVTLKTTESVYVRLYHLSADKVLTQIFPNAAQPGTLFPGGKPITLGTKNEGTLQPGEFRFRMKQPFGTEIILAVASPVPFTDTENLTFAQGEVFKTFAETDLRTASLRGTKGLSVEVTDPQGKITGQRSAPTFTARAVFTVSK